MKVYCPDLRSVLTPALLKILQEDLKYPFELTSKISESDLIMIYQDEVGSSQVSDMEGTNQPILLVDVGASPQEFESEFNRLNSIFGKELSRVYCCSIKGREVFVHDVERFLNFHSNMRADNAPLVITFPKKW